jgi:hypothetical protein
VAPCPKVRAVRVDSMPSDTRRSTAKEKGREIGALPPHNA